MYIAHYRPRHPENKRALTHTAQTASEFVDQFWLTNLRPPTIELVQRACGVLSTRDTMDALKEVGAKRGIIICNSSVIPQWVADAIATASKTQEALNVARD